MELFLGCIIPFLSFILQSYPRLFNKYFGVDVWTRLTETDHIRKNNHKIPGKITTGFIIDGYFDYPPVFPWLLSFFSKETLLKLQGFVAPFFDSLNCFVVFIIGYQLSSRLEVALLSQLIYMLTPIIALENSYLTPRSFGYLNYTLAVYPLLLYVETSKLSYLGSAYFFGTLIFLTHRFATQSYLFTVLFLTIYDRTVFYLGLFIFSSATATLITRGYYLRVLKGHLYNIYFWIKNYHYRFAHQIRGPQQIAKKNTDFVSIVYYILERFTPIGLLATNSSLIGTFIVLSNTYLPVLKQITFHLLIYKMSMLSVFMYLLAVAVLSIKRLIPIGEGQRYLEMTSAMVSVIFSYTIFSFSEIYGSYVWGGVTVILTTNLILILIAQQKAVLKDKNRTLTKDLEKVYKEINKLTGIPRIICIPHQITTMTIYHTKAEVLVNADNPGLMRITEVYPILNKSIKELTKKYKLTHLLLRETFAQKEEIKVQKLPTIAHYGDILLIDLQKYH